MAGEEKQYNVSLILILKDNERVDIEYSHPEYEDDTFFDELYEAWKINEIILIDEHITAKIRNESVNYLKTELIIAIYRG